MKRLLSACKRLQKIEEFIPYLQKSLCGLENFSLSPNPVLFYGHLELPANLMVSHLFVGMHEFLLSTKNFITQPGTRYTFLRERHCDTVYILKFTFKVPTDLSEIYPCFWDLA